MDVPGRHRPSLLQRHRRPESRELFGLVNCNLFNVDETKVCMGTWGWKLILQRSLGYRVKDADGPQVYARGKATGVHAATWMNPEDTLRVTTQTQKDVYCMTPFMRYLA